MDEAAKLYAYVGAEPVVPWTSVVGLKNIPSSCPEVARITYCTNLLQQNTGMDRLKQ